MQSIDNAKFLIFVDSVNNHNKYYRMVNNGNGTFTAEYGRVGAASQQKVYPISSWSSVYDQKIRKGYTDQTHLHSTVTSVSSDGYKPIDDALVAELCRKLQAYANQTIKTEYNVKAKEVTEKMVEHATDILYLLGKHEERNLSVEQFNQQLITLFETIPRAVPNVSDSIAKDKNDFRRIIDREEAILDVMRGQVNQYTTIGRRRTAVSADDISEKTILEALGLVIRECTDKEKQSIMEHMKSETSRFFKNAYRIHNADTDAAFEKICKSEGYKKRNIHYLYHGSRDENWWNIIGQGLVLNPKAVRTASMFGNGLYFANRAMKSMRYTSLNSRYLPGKTYSNGIKNTALMAVYKVVYKNPLDVQQWESKYSHYNLDDMKKQGTDAVFAHKGQMLFNDEIIIYNKDQCTLQYLIELAA